MSVHMVMWIGVGLIIIGGIGLIILFVEPLIKATKTVFFKQHYNQSEEREDVEKGRKLLKKTLIILIVIGFALFVSSMVLLRAPRGFDSIFSQNTEGEFTGDDTQDRPEDEQNEVISESEEMQDEQAVIVEGKTIRFKGCFFEDLEEFGAYLERLDKKQEIRLKDEYAIAATFHQVENALKEKGIMYVYFEETKGTE
ncbi:MAG: hypothetical protein HDR06_14685 [Lachnospiraceae bacterium]|nr:hypothetical protein [Lachnospiraceae bacterium]